MSEKMREEFEAFYGETEGVRFIPELNVYGCELYRNKEKADRKSDAWYYWKASRKDLELDFTYCVLPHEFVEAAKDAGLKVKP